MRPKSLTALALFAVLALAFSGSAGAKTCTITGASVNFGQVDPASSGGAITTGSVVVHCDGNFNGVLSLGVGFGAGASYSGGRKMTRTAGGGTMLYNLYADSARSHILGDGTDTSVTHNINGNKDFTQPIWARIPGNQRTVRAGSYSDTVWVTVSY